MEPFTFEMGCVKCSSHTIPQLVSEIEMLLRDKTAQPRTILCINAHIYNLAFADPALRRALNNVRIVTADGMGIVIAARLLGNRLQERCNMTEAFHAFLQSGQMPPSRGILLGTTQPEVELAAANIERRAPHCRILEAHSGYLTDSDYVRILQSQRNLDFVFLGMGSPKSERITMLATEVCPEAVVWTIGAGTIKIVAGTLKEAPLMMRRCGLQWAHRLYAEPSALWRRYLFGNPLFIMRIMATACKRQKNGSTPKAKNGD
jgi:N-acetylglucosaminyldiphosphoundecaprenol N-acetyl-beta-D-mannosaminyltransferase